MTMFLSDRMTSVIPSATAGSINNEWNPDDLSYLYGPGKGRKDDWGYG
jgi:hypothetical protein